MTAFPNYEPKKSWDNNQSLLVQSAKDVLDITAGYRGMWKTYSKYLPDVARVIFLDKRSEVEPDIVADHTSTPFPSSSFNIVVYDPPHLICRPGQSYYKTGFGRRFWAFSDMTSLIKDLHAVNREAARVLKSKGVLILKWTELSNGSNPSRYVAVCYLTNFKEFGKIEFASKSGHNQHNKLSLTWLEKII